MALVAASIYAGPLVQEARSTDSSSACWNLGGYINEKTGACILPEPCPPGTVQDSKVSTTKCDPISLPSDETKQLGSVNSSSTS